MNSRCLAALAMLAGMAAPAAAQELTNAQRDAAITFTLNNTWHTILHEAGHLFVDQFGLPVLGKEEDAVDTFATLTMLADGTAESLQGLIDTVDGWVYSEQRIPTRGFANADFYGVHSLDIQRSFAIACLMVGHSYTDHTWFATRTGLPIDRQESCEDDLKQAQYSWDLVLAPHVRGDRPAGARVTTRYHSDEGTYADIAAILKQDRFLERAAAWLTEHYVLPHPVRLVAEVCGEVNAFYYFGSREIVLCYEWPQYFYDFFISDVMPIREHFATMRELKLEKLGR